MTHRRQIPEHCECPGCGRMVKTMRRRFVRHSEYQTGPLCPESGRVVTEETLKETRLRRRAEQVLLWAHVLRDEDPRRVHAWIRQATREELEVLMMVALAAIPPDMTLTQAYGWTRIS